MDILDYLFGQEGERLDEETRGAADASWARVTADTYDAFTKRWDEMFEGKRSGKVNEFILEFAQACTRHSRFERHLVAALWEEVALNNGNTQETGDRIWKFAMTHQPSVIDRFRPDRPSIEVEA